MNLREQFKEFLKANIESNPLVEINNTDENYIDWLEAKVTSSEEDKQNILKAFDIYRNLTYTNENALNLLLEFVKDKMIIIGTVEVKRWFERKKKQHIN